MTFSESLQFVKALEFLQKLGFGVKIYADTNIVNGKYKASCEQIIAFAKSKGFVGTSRRPKEEENED